MGEESAFNKSLDGNFGLFRILDVEVRASEVFFSLEPETYRICPAEFDDADDGDTEIDGKTET